jgi:hypothetical protein
MRGFQDLVDEARDGVAYWTENAALDYAYGLGELMEEGALSVEELAGRAGREPFHVFDALSGDWLTDIEEMALLAYHAGGRVEIKVISADD